MEFVTESVAAMESIMESVAAMESVNACETAAIVPQVFFRM